MVSLRRKISGATDLSSVVRTMKAVAASSIGQYEKSVHALNDYYRSVELGLGLCLRNQSQTIAVAEKKHQSGSIEAVVFGSDQGLVGQFNDIIADYTLTKLSKLPCESRICAVGERVYARLVDAGLNVYAHFELPSSVEGIAPLIGKILLESESRRERDVFTELYLFYNRLESPATYSPFDQRLLPLDDAQLSYLTRQPWPSGNYAEVFGNSAATLRAFINEYLFVSLFRSCAESLASENASRLLAMQRAEHNIDELLVELNEIYHQQRKDGIDAELFEVIASFDSLQKDSRR